MELKLHTKEEENHWGKEGLEGNRRKRGEVITHYEL